MRLDNGDGNESSRHHHRPAAAADTAGPGYPWLSVFQPYFTAPTWQHVLALVAGVVLAPGKRTVTQVLRVLGLADQTGFARYHEVLNRARWDTRALSRRRLIHLLDRLLPEGPVVVGIDDVPGLDPGIERRWGAKITARGIYCDPVRSSKGHFVKTSGLRWLSLMVILPTRGRSDSGRCRSGAQRRALLTAIGTAVWYKAGTTPVLICWVLVRDPAGEYDPSSFLCTDIDVTPEAILG